jgi:phosphohistidine phosphatase
MMDLILWRHAEAQDGTPDMERELTGKGQKQAAKMAAFLRARLPEDTRILVSPAMRTQQTARALTKHFTIEPDVGTGVSAQGILDAAGWPEGKGAVLVVGHQPTLGEVAALLLTDSKESLSIKKGAVWWFSSRTNESGDQADLRLAIAPESLQISGE